MGRRIQGMPRPLPARQVPVAPSRRVLMLMLMQ